MSLCGSTGHAVTIESQGPDCQTCRGSFHRNPSHVFVPFGASPRIVREEISFVIPTSFVLTPC